MRGSARHFGFLVQGLGLGWALACGQVEGLPEDGAGGGASGGADVGVGGSATGGANTGGTTGEGTGATPPGAGGTNVGPDEPEFDECGAPLGVFDPPCTTEDVHVYAGCSFNDTVNFTYPLGGLAIPTSEDLQVVLLPMEYSVGLGGASSWDTPPRGLPVSLYPVTAGTVTESSFSITDANASLTVYVEYPLDLDDFLVERANPQSNSYPYHEGRVAVLDGDTVVEQRRLFLDPLYVCLIK